MLVEPILFGETIMTNTVPVPVTSPLSATMGMSLDEARRTLWISENPRPMGELIDSGYLTAEKLVWAARTTRTLRLQAAAKVLLRHMQLAATPGGAITPTAVPAPETVH